MKIYYDSTTESVEVINGAPPVDQSATVAQLVSDKAALTSANAALQTKVVAMTAALQTLSARADARIAADAAKVDGQDDKDTIAGVLAP